MLDRRQYLLSISTQDCNAALQMLKEAVSKYKLTSSCHCMMAPFSRSDSDKLDKMIPFLLGPFAECKSEKAQESFVGKSDSSRNMSQKVCDCQLHNKSYHI